MFRSPAHRSMFDELPIEIRWLIFYHYLRDVSGVGSIQIHVEKRTEYFLYLVRRHGPAIRTFAAINKGFREMLTPILWHSIHMSNNFWHLHYTCFELLPRYGEHIRVLNMDDWERKGSTKESVWIPSQIVDYVGRLVDALQAQDHAHEPSTWRTGLTSLKSHSQNNYILVKASDYDEYCLDLFDHMLDFVPNLHTIKFGLPVCMIRTMYTGESISALSATKMSEKSSRSVMRLLFEPEADPKHLLVEATCVGGPRAHCESGSSGDKKESWLYYKLLSRETEVMVYCSTNSRACEGHPASYSLTNFLGSIPTLRQMLVRTMDIRIFNDTNPLYQSLYPVYRLPNCRFPNSKLTRHLTVLQIASDLEAFSLMDVIRIIEGAPLLYGLVLRGPFVIQDDGETETGRHIPSDCNRFLNAILRMSYLTVLSIQACEFFCDRMFAQGIAHWLRPSGSNVLAGSVACSRSESTPTQRMNPRREREQRRGSEHTINMVPSTPLLESMSHPDLSRNGDRVPASSQGEDVGTEDSEKSIILPTIQSLVIKGCPNLSLNGFMTFTRLFAQSLKKLEFASVVMDWELSTYFQGTWVYNALSKLGNVFPDINNLGHRTFAYPMANPVTFPALHTVCLHTAVSAIPLILLFRASPLRNVTINVYRDHSAYMDDWLFFFDVFANSLSYLHVHYFDSPAPSALNAFREKKKYIISLAAKTECQCVVGP